MQTELRATARTYSFNLYGRVRDLVAAEQTVMLETLRGQVRVVRVYRRTQWIAPVTTTDLTLSVAQIIQSDGARWKVEAGFREIKQEIGSARTQTRNPDALTNHLQFCPVATTITWIDGTGLEAGPRAALRRRASHRIGLRRCAPSARPCSRRRGFRGRLRRSRPWHPKSPHRCSHAPARELPSHASAGLARTCPRGL
jgi:hypothetical protein